MLVLLNTLLIESQHVHDLCQCNVAITSPDRSRLAQRVIPVPKAAVEDVQTAQSDFQHSTPIPSSHQLKGRPFAGKATGKSGRTSDGGDIAQSKTFLVARCRFSWRIGKRDTSLTPQHHNSKEACLTLGSERERAELAQQHQQQQQQQQKNKQQMCPIKRKDDCDTRK